MFKAIRVYQFTQPFTMPENIDELVAAYQFHECQKHQLATFGFVPVIGECMTGRAGASVVFKARKQTKILPASEIARKLDDHAATYQHEHGRPMPRKERSAIKEDIVHQMLPVAFSRYETTWAWVNDQRLYVAVTGHARAEDFNALLRGALGSLPVKPWGGEQPGEVHFTQWLQTQEPPAPFELSTAAKLCGTGDSPARVTLKDQLLTGDEVASMIQHGKLCVEVELYCAERCAVTVTSDYALKGIKWHDTVHERNDDMVGSSAADQMDADLHLYCGEVIALVDELSGALQG